MKQYHSDHLIRKIYIKMKLQKNGLDVDSNGKIQYNENKMKIDADAIYLLRHAETIATQNHEFMNDTSDNAHICKKGIEDIISIAENVDDYCFDEIIICSNIPRVLETSYVFKLLKPNYNYTFLKNYKGIDNNGWEGKTPENLKGMDLEDYIQREEKNNIFAKSSKGGSWGQVLINTIKLVKYINRNCKNKRILLISQGSILKALKILTHLSKTPWDQYDTKKLYNLDKNQNQNNYAKINCLYDRKEENIDG